MSNTATKNKTEKADKEVGNYSETGIHPNDKTDQAGHKEKFDRGDPTEDKKDAIQQKTANVKKNVEIPREYAEAGIHSDSEVDETGRKKKFDRAAPEETQDAPDNVKHQKGKTEKSEPNYVEQEAIDRKNMHMDVVSNLSEIEFLELCLTKTAAGGWTNHLDDDIKNRLEYLKKDK